MTDAPTPEELTAELRAIQRSYDSYPESTHQDMDDALCRVLRSMGFGEAVKVFEDQEMWYS